MTKNSRKVPPAVKWARAAARVLARNSGESLRWGLETATKMIVNDTARKYAEVVPEMFASYHPDLLNQLTV